MEFREYLAELLKMEEMDENQLKEKYQHRFPAWREEYQKIRLAFAERKPPMSEEEKLLLNAILTEPEDRRELEELLQSL